MAYCLSSSVFGIFFFNRPVFVLNDPQLIKQVLIKNFDHFIDHPSFTNDGNIEPIMYNSLILLTGEKWRNMRSVLSPAFTGTKLRQMFTLILKCSEQTVEQYRTDTLANSSRPWIPELKQLFSYFANDVIATAAFGVEVNSVQDNNNRFYGVAKKSLDVTSLRFVFRTILASIVQKISTRFGMRGFTADIVGFFDDLVHATIADRRKNHTFRPDLIQLLMQADDQTKKTNFTMSRDDITAQCYLFFLAGFETISGTLSMVCHQLVEHPHIQLQLQAEIDALRNELHGRTINYDDLLKLKYMDMVISGKLCCDYFAIFVIIRTDKNMNLQKRCVCTRRQCWIANVVVISK